MRNHCSFTGRTTRDVDYKVLDNGKRRAVFTIAVEAYGKSKEKEADFIQIKAFDDLAATLADNVGKGSLITVDARFKPGKYQKEGKTEYTFDFIAFNVDFQILKPVGGAQENGNDQPMYGQGQPYLNNGSQNFGPGNLGGQPPYHQPQYGGQPPYGDQPNYGRADNNNQPTYNNFPNHPPNGYPNPYER